MPRFFVKTAILISVLFVCVIAGMVIAKESMVDMGAEATQKHELLNFELEEFGGGTPQKINREISTTTSKTLDERLKELEKINGFNAYSGLGETFSNGVKNIFDKGLDAASTMFGKIIHVVL